MSSNVAALSIVVAGEGVTHYRRKLGPASTTICADEIGYGTETVVATKVSDSLAPFDDGPIRLCIVARGANTTFQGFATATAATWANDMTPPAAPATLSATSSEASISLSWTSSAGAAGYVVVRTTNPSLTFEPSRGDAYLSGNEPKMGEKIVYVGPNSSTVVNGLQNGSSHRFAVYSFDDLYNYSTTASEASAIPVGPLAIWQAFSGWGAGEVRVMTSVGTTLYVAGGFSFLGPFTGSGVIVNRVTGASAPPTGVKITGEVLAAVADGSGGWFVGGEFYGFDSVRYLLHIKSDGSLDTWDPALDGKVRAIVRSGSTLYVGGEFRNVGAVTRNRAAAISTTTGLASSWHPNVDNTVNALSINGSTVYLGGYFAYVNGIARNCIAAVTTSGTLSTWNPNANHIVNALAIGSGVVYAGGKFTSIGGQSRKIVAAIDATTGTATAWNPDSTSSAPEVMALAIDGSTLYATGYFDNIGGAARSNLAAIDVSTGSATAWNPTITSTGKALALTSDDVLIGGYFSKTGALDRNNAAAVAKADGTVRSWDPSFSSNVNAIAVDGDAVFVGGRFLSSGGRPRRNLAAIDLATGKATDWNPKCYKASGESMPIWSMVRDGATMYVAGNFDNCGGAARSHLAAIDLATGAALPLNVAINQRLYNVAKRGTTLYLGGDFTTVGGQTRNHFAAIDTDGNVLPLDPNPNGSTVRAIAVTDDAIYLSGDFTTVAGQSRQHLAALNSTTGVLKSWNPGMNGEAARLLVAGGDLYVAGSFSTIGSATRKNIARLKLSDAALSAWAPDPDQLVFDLVPSGDRVYFTGAFTKVGATDRGGIAAVDALLGGLLPFSGNGFQASGIAVSGLGVYVGGAFFELGGKSNVYGLGVLGINSGLHP